MKDSFGCIYKITNLMNNKCYIGQTTSKDSIKYIKQHFKTAFHKNSERPLYRAIRKYKLHNFKWEILGYCYSKKDLDEAEVECIYFFRSFGSSGECFDKIYGYNLTKGGEGVRGLPSERNPMHNTSVKEYWIKKYGKEKAELLWQEHNKKTSLTLNNRSETDKQKLSKIRSDNVKGSKNFMYGKGGVPSVIINKYGEEKGLEKIKKMTEKRLNTINNWEDETKRKYHEKMKIINNKDKEKRIEKRKETVKNRSLEKKTKIFKQASERSSGKNNPRALKIKYFSSLNEEFLIIGEQKKFCKEHNLNDNAMLQIRRGLRDNYRGWKCILIEN